MTEAALNKDRILTAIGLRLLSAALLMSMAALIKLAERHGAVLPEVLFFRQAGALVFMLGWLAAGPGLGSVATQRMPAHILRTTVGLSSMACMFATLMLLPLAEATTLQFTLPIFATILGALILREATGWHRWSAVAIGFAGVVIVAQPGSDHIPIAGAALGLVAALLSALVTILLRQIGRTESAATTVFWFSALSMIPLGPLYLLNLQAHPPITWALLLMVGLVGGAGQLAMTSSLKFAPVSVVVPMDYSALIWATLYGWLLFGVLPGAWTWVGAPIIVASGLYIVWREHIRRRHETEQAIV